MSGIPDRSLVIGVDAGGTRSRACLADPGGAVLGRGTGGPGNALSVCRADLTRHLTEAIAEAVRPAEGARDRVAAVFGGFAGAPEGLGPERGRDLALSCLREALTSNGITAPAVAVGGDIEIALGSAPGAPRDGLVLIAGTGAIAARLVGGRCSRVVDGHGWLLGDDGSGYWLGAQAVRAALAALDGSGARTALVAEVAAHYLPERTGRPFAPTDSWGVRHDLAEAIISRAYAQPPSRLGLLSPVAVSVASEGDAVALRLLDRAADLLAATVRVLGPGPGEPLAVTGGLLGPGGPLLSRVTARLDGLEVRVFPVADGTVGAAALARNLPRPAA